MKRETWLIICIAGLFAAIGAYFGINRLNPTPPAADAATLLFQHSLPDLEGKPQKLDQWKGKVLLVNFWATWCPPCVEEMPELSALQTEQASKNLQIIGIGVDSADKMQEFAKKFKITYPLYVAGMGGGELSRQLGNQAGGLPYTVLIGPDGRIRKTFIGRLHIDDLRRELTATH